jgi:hypothetical protein
LACYRNIRGGFPMIAICTECKRAMAIQETDKFIFVECKYCLAEEVKCSHFVSAKFLKEWA